MSGEIESAKKRNGQTNPNSSQAQCHQWIGPEIGRQNAARRPGWARQMRNSKCGMGSDGMLKPSPMRQLTKHEPRGTRNEARTTSHEPRKSAMAKRTHGRCKHNAAINMAGNGALQYCPNQHSEHRCCSHAGEVAGRLRWKSGAFFLGLTDMNDH